MKGNLLRPILVAGLLASAVTTAAHAQLTAQINGAIQDGTGAVVPAANVTVVNEDTGLKRETKTNQAGIFTIPLLQPGIYRIGVQAEGFRTISRSGVQLNVAQ